MQESILCIFVKIWSFYPKFGNISCVVTLKMKILVGAITKCFQKKKLNAKAYYKQVNKHSLKMNVNLTAKLSKATLKYIEFWQTKVVETCYSDDLAGATEPLQ